MKSKHILFICLTILLTLGVHTTEVYAQRGNGLELYLGTGPSSLALGGGIVESVNVSGNSGARFGANFLLGINDNLAVGAGLGLNRYSYFLDIKEFSSDDGEASLENILPAYNPFSKSIVATDIEESLEISEFIVPVFLDFQFGSGKVNPYGRLGFAIAVPSGTFQNTQGTISYEGEFADLPRENLADGTFDVTLRDLDKYDFNAGIGMSDSLQDLSLKSSTMALQLSLGIRFNISNNLYLFGEGFFSRSSNFSAYNVNMYVPAETSDEYQTMISGVSSASVSKIGLNVGLGLTFGNNGEPDPSKTKNGGSGYLSVPLAYIQDPSTRRKPDQMDPEFEMLVTAMLSGLTFKPSNYKIGLNKVTGSLEYNSKVGAPEAITVSAKGKNNYMTVDEIESKYSANEETFNLMFAPPNNNTFTISFEDVDTESEIDGFFMEITAIDQELRQNKEVIFDNKKVGSGETVYKLYDHPRIQYKVVLSHPCYPTQTFFIEPSDFNKSKTVQAESEGEAEEILLPISSSESEFLRIQGAILRGNNRTPLSGTYSDGEIALYAGCGESPGNDFQVALQKPLGYNLYTGTVSSRWKNPELTIRVKNGNPTQEMKLEAIPTYNLFYVDISEAQNRNAFRRPVLESVNELRDNGQEFLVYLSNGQAPFTADNPTDFRTVLRQLVLSAPEVPKVGVDRQLMLNKMDVAEILPSRRIVNMHFFMSESLYNSSREQLINQLTAAFPEGRENIRIFIHTDFEISDANKLERGLYRTPVEYIYLR